jgi:hypothetical protein
MSTIIYELPRPPKKPPPRARRVGFRITQHDYDLMVKIATHAGVKLTALMRSYIDLGIQVSIEKLKGQQEK